MSGPQPAAPSTPGAAPTRGRIKALAAELYVRRGHDGFSFGDVAEAIGTTRANIHYHFGNKRQLMAELIDDFVADALARIARHWTTPGQGFRERLHAQRDDLRAFFQRFNPTGTERSMWSPISRLRHDIPFLGTLAVAALARVNEGYDACLHQAVLEAVAAGELQPGTPVDDVVRLLRGTIMSCGPMTQDSGDFAEVDRLFAAIERVILAAWGGAPPA
jgi:AcrR family transcriptional regulator